MKNTMEIRAVLLSYVTHLGKLAASVTAIIGLWLLMGWPVPASRAFVEDEISKKTVTKEDVASIKKRIETIRQNQTTIKMDTRSAKEAAQATDRKLDLIIRLIDK